MTNIKIITLFNTNEKIPLMTCVVKYIEVNKYGVKFTLENGNNICVKDYDFFFVSASTNDYDKQRIVNAHERLTSELSQVRKETIRSPEPTTLSPTLLLLFLTIAIMFTIPW